MKILKNNLIKALSSTKKNLVAATMLALFVIPSSTALAGMPNLSVQDIGGNTVRLSVSGADPYADIALYQRSDNSNLWTTTYNFGRTDGYGYFSSVVGMGGYSQNIEYYVVVGGQQSVIQRVSGSGYLGGNYNNCEYGYNNDRDWHGRHGNWSNGNYNNSVRYCPENFSGNNNQVTLSQTSVSVNQGQSVVISIYGGYSGYYVASNTSTNVTTTLSGSQLTVYGSNVGSSTLNICANNVSNRCASLYVTVNGGYYNNGYPYNNYTGGLYFSTTTLPTAYTNQYYSQQISVSGGSGSYYFSLNSGQLPSGLSLNSNGLITGTPTCYNSGAPFQVRVQDGSGRISYQNYTLTVSCSGSNYPPYYSGVYSNPGSGLLYPYGYNAGGYVGSVAGISTYKNGTLISENGTVYIVYKNTKSGFANAWAFTGLGFKFSNVMNGYASGLVDSGYTVWSANQRHPWGSWIKSGNTVYFVHESGLIPVTNYDIFLNNGGSDALVVNANMYDFQTTMQAPLEYGDFRLR